MWDTPGYFPGGVHLCASNCAWEARLVQVRLGVVVDLGHTWSSYRQRAYLQSLLRHPVVNGVAWGSTWANDGRLAGSVHMCISSHAQAPCRQ